ncbi:tyrosine protein phosphatase [Bacillus sp. Bva_UNVM-123]|uniref:tyrosine-protein phosphatase n=1 Tax=Bacillus sp. Bva_UNVM-123 TaxID=2829798 RepID=UPI00391F82E7
MVDLHCHIIPCIDDGPGNLNDCLIMANRAVSAGITHIFATPHHLNGQYENSKWIILKYVDELNEYFKDEGIPITVLPGQEIRIHREFFHSLKTDELLTLANAGKYILIELPFLDIPSYTHEIIYELLLKGITPIIAHPERNRKFIEDSRLLVELVQEGALTQLTAGSIIGRFGKKVRTFAETMIEHNLAHFIASDAHNVTTRGFFLNEAYDKITKSYGVSQMFYFRENAQLLLNGQSIQREEPIPIRKKIFRLF